MCRALLAGEVLVAPVVRDAEKFAATGLHIVPQVADLADADALRAALAGARIVVSTAHARHTAAVLAAAPEDATFVLLGSTRKFTRWPDAHGNGVIAGEAAFLASGRNGVMLHPTMIYGADGEDNVRRLATLIRRLPVIPLPGGGRSLVQPIHQGDVTRALLAAIAHKWEGPHSLVVAGPEPVRYANLVRAVAAATGRPRPRIVPFPVGPLVIAARLAGRIPGVPRVRPEEMRRMTEDKHSISRP